MRAVLYTILFVPTANEAHQEVGMNESALSVCKCFLDACFKQTKSAIFLHSIPMG